MALGAAGEVLASVTTARCNEVECCRTEAEDVHSLASPTHNVYSSRRDIRTIEMDIVYQLVSFFI